MIRVFCYKCKRELNEPGGVILAPPIDNSAGKYHICVKCFKELAKWMCGHPKNAPKAWMKEMYGT